MRKRLVLTLLFVAMVSLLEVSGWAQGCSMCRTALEQSKEGQAIAGSFNYGILFLMGAPYAMIGMVAAAIFRAYRKQVAKKNESDPL